MAEYPSVSPPRGAAPGAEWEPGDPLYQRGGGYTGLLLDFFREPHGEAYWVKRMAWVAAEAEPTPWGWMR